MSAPPAAVAAKPALELVIDGLEDLSGAVAAPDGSDRIYLLEHYTGKILVLEDNLLSDQVFLDISGRMEPENWEEGLLGLALPPDGMNAAYVTYIDRSGDLVLSRFATTEGVRRGLNTSEHIVFRVQRDHRMHHCGHIAFGPHDGKLYLCVGDTQTNRDIAPRSQDLAVPLGKILRFDVHAASAAAAGAGGQAAAQAAPPETVAYGLRNPWRFSFDPASGGLLIPDVGRHHNEELNFAPAHQGLAPNFGWPLAEGNECLADCETRDDLVWPMFEYTHPPERCGIIGGATYRGTATPAWRGVYVFGDLCSGEFWALRKPGPDAEVRELMDTEVAPSAIVEGPKGELLVVDGPGGALHRLHLPASAEDGWRPAQAVVEETALEARRSGFSFTHEQLEQERAQRKRMLASKRWRYTEPITQLYEWLRRPPN